MNFIKFQLQQQHPQKSTACTFTESMNIALLTKQWPRHNHSGHLEKTISLVESLINMSHKVVVCTDEDNMQAKEKLKEYPLEMVDINSKKISASLNALNKVEAKPNLFIFDSFESEEKYSAFIYNRWNKCSRVLAVDELKGLQKWRRSMYKTMPGMLIPNGAAMAPEKPQDIFTIEEQRSVIRSDYILTSNQHNYHLINKHLLNSRGNKSVAQINYGFPLHEYYKEVSELMYRPFRERQNFVFLANFQNQSSKDTAFVLVHELWPLIKEKLKDCELHILGTHGQSGINQKVFLTWSKMNKEQFKKLGIFIKGVMKETQQLSEYKALLNPSIFSTGPHIKVIQSWFMHLPVVTTPIGAQGHFLQTYDPSSSATTQNNTNFMFSSERQFTQEQRKNAQKIKNYYNSRILTKNTGLTFGGSFQNFSYRDFIQSAVKIHDNEQYWSKCLANGQKNIKINQNDRHLEVVIKKALVSIEMATYQGRGRPEYANQWKRYTRSAEFNKKIRGQK